MGLALRVRKDQLDIRIIHLFYQIRTGLRFVEPATCIMGRSMDIEIHQNFSRASNERALMINHDCFFDIKLVSWTLILRDCFRASADLLERKP